MSSIKFPCQKTYRLPFGSIALTATYSQLPIHLLLGAKPCLEAILTIMESSNAGELNGIFANKAMFNFTCRVGKIY